MILNLIISSSFHELRYLGPFVSKQRVDVHKLDLFFIGPVGLADLRVKVILPLFSTVLGGLDRSTLGRLIKLLRY